ncbi:MAG: MBL fold metallo-hydrolase [Euryarchaeota archaeon]|nr:MBL fold metallo-hydrolase [Euryarchaeota archaeon]
MAIHVETLVTGSFVENGYVLWRDDSDAAIAIDPGAEPERWVAWFEEKGLTPAAILCTHCHLDHCGAVKALQERFQAPFLIHHEEQVMLDALPVQCEMFGHPKVPKPKVTDHLFDDQVLDHAGYRITCIPTPGHTPGGTCFHVEEIGTVFTGDTLFAGSVGRTDFPGGETETLLASLKDLCERLPDETRVLSGHGPETTIGTERTTNPFFRVER